VLLAAAPHIISPLQFVLPHEPHLRPAWMIRAGLFLYDHLGGRRTLPSSFTTKLAPDGWGAGLKAQFKTGFVYSDARVDDARLVVVNAIDARERGADIRTYTEMLAARRVDGVWEIEFGGVAGERGTLRARGLVNAAGPWVARVHDEAGATRGKERVRHVKGSHIVVPRVHSGKHAYILQNADQRIVFVIPYQDAFSLIGTTDIAVEEYEHPRISAEEIEYLCAIAGAYLEHPVTPADIVWTYSGVRPLYDDGASDPAAVTRDYVIKLEADRGKAPLLSIFGGKITTYRRLAESVLAELAPYFADMRPAWTRGVPLPGGDMAAGIADYGRELSSRYPGMPASLLEALLHRHGTRTPRVLGDARSATDLGAHFGHTLYAAEIDYCMREEWARDGEDLLWRRTKCGLHLGAAQREAVASFMRARVR
jgi:glycerol-3-phosphate dehydrogenase